MKREPQTGDLILQHCSPKGDHYWCFVLSDAERVGDPRFPGWECTVFDFEDSIIADYVFLDRHQDEWEIF